MVQGTTLNTRPFSKTNIEGRIARDTASRNVVQGKPDRRSLQSKLRGVALPAQEATTMYPHLENVDTNIGASSSNASTPCVSPFKSKLSTKPQSSLPLSHSTHVDSVQEPPSGYGGGLYLSRTSSNVSSLAASSDEEATTTEASAPSSASGSDAENNVSTQQSVRRKERISRHTSRGPPQIERSDSADLEKTPTKPSRPVARKGTPKSPCPSPARSLRSGVQRALALQHQPSFKDHCHQALQSHFDLEENASFWDDHNVQVVVRARPISGKEAAKPDFSRCLRQEGAHAITWLGQPETRFTFDHVAGENISQEKLFQVVGLPIVENCMAGYNSCMFAYGQTGSGKTHTMLGDITELGDRPSDNRGMTPRIFEYLFSRIQKEEDDRQLEQLRYVCKCSFLEIYNEQITDLLEPLSSNLQMREDSKKGVYVENLTEKVVASVQDVILLLLKGAANRKVASTNMNRESSRSHSVFTCSIESKWETNSLSNMRFGRLNLVDLAGSERQKSSGAEGDRLKEAASINKSLSTLGLVIMILVDIANGKPRHVPYRDSKLTFLLQDSLGGNSKTAIIATISPSSCCSMETLSTLKFAQRAKFIQNNAVVNEDASGEMLALRREIQQLKEEVSRLRCQTISSLRRECRRDSNDFFRLSMAGKDLFDAADKDRRRTDVDDDDCVSDLQSAELLEKIKALEAVLAGALRREQVAETATTQLATEIEKANKLIEEQEIQVNKLLHLHGDEEIEASERPQVSWAEKLEVAERLQYNRVVTKLDLENARLTEQLHCYRAFFDDGEREMIAAEIQGLRDQVLELLDGKLAMERGSLSTTIAQGDSYRMELETCRNDLTNCLEASSQLQRHVDELQTLVHQLTRDCAEKDKDVDRMKGSCDQNLEEITDLKARLQAEQEADKLHACVHAQLERDLHDSVQEVEKLRAEILEFEEKCVKMANLKEKEMRALQIGWETASAKLYHDLAEGERTLLEVGQEMDEILGEDWVLKSMTMLQHDTKSSTRWSLESTKSPKGGLQDMQQEYFKCRNSCNTDDIFGEKRSSRRKPSFGMLLSPRVSAVMAVEEKLKLEASVAHLEHELEEHKQRLEHTLKELERLKTEKLAVHEEMEAFAAKSTLTASEMLEENVDLKGEVQQLRAELHAQNEAMILASQKLDKEVKLLEENVDLKDEVKKLHAELHAQNEAMILANQKLDREVKLLEENVGLKAEVQQLLHAQNEATILANQKLDRDMEMVSQKLASAHAVEDELRTQVSFLQVELEKQMQKIEELDLQTTSRAESHREELQRKGLQINDLEAYLGLKSAELEAVQNELLLVTTSLQQSRDELGEFKVKEAGLVAELLGLKDQLSRNVDVTRDAETCLREELLAVTELLKNAQFERDGLEEELASAQASVLEHQNTVTVAHQRIETDGQTIRHLEESVERLQTELQRKEDLLYGLEFDISLLQEHAAEDTDFKQELLTANSRISELQAEVHTRCEELKQLESAKVEVEEQLANSAEAMKQVEDELLEAGTQAALVVEESQSLSSKMSQLQTRVSTLEAELAEKAEVLNSLEKELMVTRVTATRMTMECSHKTTTLASLQAEVETLGQQVESLQGSITHRVVELDAFHGELLVSLMTELCLQELNSDVKTSTHIAELQACLRSQLEEQKGAVEDELRTATKHQLTLQDEIQNLTQQVVSLQDELTVASESSTDDHQKLKTMRTEIRALLKERDGLETEVGERATTVSFLESELIVARTSAEASSEAFAALETAFQAEVAEVRKVAGGVSEENSALRAQVVGLQALVVSLETRLREELASFEAQILDLDIQVADERGSVRCKTRENDELRVQIETWQQKCCALEAQVDAMKTQVGQREEQLRALEEQLDRAEAEALQLMVNTKPREASDSLRLEVEGSKDALCAKVSSTELKEQENANESSEEIQTLKDARYAELQALQEELRRAATHEASALEEARKLETVVSSLKNHNSALEKQLEVMKLEAEKLRQARDEFEMELQGMKNRMAMIQAVQSTASRDGKGLQAAQAANLDLQRRLDEKETEVSQLYKRMATLHSQNEAQASRLEDMETELAHVQQELDELHCQCHDKDAQLSTLKKLNKEAEKLTQDVMRDLHNVKLDISNYASLVNQQQLELISERTQHADKARAKDEEICHLQTQLNQERQTWMLEMNHKQAEMVVARVLSEKMRLKNKTLSAEYKKLKADLYGKRKKLKLLEQQLKELTTDARRADFDEVESEADFDEVEQFQALLAQANDTRRDSTSKESDADFDEVQQFQALLAQANGHELAHRQQQ